MRNKVEKFSSIDTWSDPVFFSFIKELVDLCSAPARGTLLISNSDKRSGQGAGLLLESVKFNIHFNASRLLLTVNQQPCKEGWGDSFAYTTVRHSWCVVSYQCSTSLSERKKCPVGLSVPSGGFCWTTSPIFLSHTSWSAKMAPCERGSPPGAWPALHSAGRRRVFRQWVICQWCAAKLHLYSCFQRQKNCRVLGFVLRLSQRDGGRNRNTGRAGVSLRLSGSEVYACCQSGMLTPRSPGRMTRPGNSMKLGKLPILRV